MKHKDGKKRDIWFSGGSALTMDAKHRVVKDVKIHIQDGIIASIGSRLAIPRGARVVDTKGCLVLPGLVNTHTHAPMSVFRGIADDLPLKRWLMNHIFPLEHRWMSPALVHFGTLLSCVEMIRTGTTTFNDMYYFEEAVAKASDEAGMRVVCGQTLMEKKHVDYSAAEALERLDEFVDAVLKFPRATPSLAPHAIYSVSKESWEKAIAYSQDRGVRIHTHCSEVMGEVDACLKRFRCTPVQFFDRLDLWSCDVTAAHVVCVTDQDIKILGRHRTGIAHNIESNLKIGTRLSPVVELRAAGARVGLGTDSVASNNNLDLFQEADTAAKLQCYRRGPGALKARDVVRMLTIEGAKAIGLGSRIGSIEPGKEADIIAVDVNQGHLVPSYDPYSLLVYSATGRDVKHCMVAGRLLMEDYCLATLDERAIIKEALRTQKKMSLPRRG